MDSTDREKARLPPTPSTPSLGPRSAFQRTDSTRISIGRGRTRNSLKQPRPGPSAPPSPLSRVSALSAPPSPSVSTPVALRSKQGQGRPISVGTSQPDSPSPSLNSLNSLSARRGRGRPVSLPNTVSPASPGYSPPHAHQSNGFKKMAGTGGQTWQRDAADQNFDYMFKLLIIGNSSVGKTSFLFRYADDSFTSAFVSTVGIDFKVKTVFRQDKRVKLQIWDTAGQERYRTITTAYYRGAMGFILMYDVTSEESFSSVHDWCTQIKTYSWDNAQVILVGNKCDMEDERVISYERGKQLADSLGLQFFETSAKENINVRAVFERLVDMICEKMSESLDADPNVNSNKGTRLTDTAQPSNVNCNC